MDAALRFVKVVKKFGRCHALDGLDLSVPAGVAMGLVGSNGAGKTTTFAVASGFTRMNAGSVDILGEGPFLPRRHAGRLAVMPQDTNFPPYARIQDILTYFARLQGIPNHRIHASVASILEWVHLQDRADAQIRTLSHGMRRRVVIAQAFLGQPEIVLLDEPMSGLDPREVVHIRQLLRQRPKQQTIMISSHNLHEIERVCDQVAFIREGRLIRHASMEEVTRRHHVVSYHLAPDRALELAPLQQTLPGAKLTMTEPGHLICQYSDSAQTVDAVNAIVLQYLLAHRIPVFEIRRGNELESIYMGDHTL